jgi:hypothetical protein
VVSGGVLGKVGNATEGNGCGREAYNAQVSIDCCDALVGALFEELGCDDLLDGQHDAVLAPDADRGAAVLDRLHGVLDLEVAAIGGEDGVGEIVACAYRRLYFGAGRG